MHQKVVLVDDAAAMVGTANFDNRSGPSEYSDRPFWFKVAVRLARLTAPVQ